MPNWFIILGSDTRSLDKNNSLISIHHYSRGNDIWSQWIEMEMFCNSEGFPPPAPSWSFPSSLSSSCLHSFYPLSVIYSISSTNSSIINSLSVLFHSLIVFNYLWCFLFSFVFHHSRPSPFFSLQSSPFRQTPFFQRGITRSRSSHGFSRRRPTISPLVTIRPRTTTVTHDGSMDTVLQPLENTLQPPTVTREGTVTNEFKRIPVRTQNSPTGRVQSLRLIHGGSMEREESRERVPIAHPMRERPLRISSSFEVLPRRENNRFAVNTNHLLMLSHYSKESKDEEIITFETIPSYWFNILSISFAFNNSLWVPFLKWWRVWECCTHIIFVSIQYSYTIPYRFRIGGPPFGEVTTPG